MISSRLDYITNLLVTKKYITVEEVSQHFEISGETVRRDFKLLEQRSILKRTHGGAYLEGSIVSDVGIEVRKNMLKENKEEIAKLCCDFISPEDTIFLDNSTTSFEVAKKITHLPVTVVTFSLLITQFLSNYKNVRIVSTGGTLDTVNMCFIGKMAIDNISSVYTRRGFISCRSISDKYGIMDSNEQVAQIRSAGIKNSYSKYLIADHTKFSNTALYKIADLGDFDYIITDQRPNAEWLEVLDNRGIKLVYSDDVKKS
ncbi:MAG: DeoR/GlpR family DNA-binding transcription regulator [Lachnospirales bacterium]